MVYLSSNYTPEKNLKIIAENQVLLTEEANREKLKLENCHFKIFFAKTLTIATLALGILLGVTHSLLLGTCVSISAIIPISVWIHFSRKYSSVELTFNHEREKLKVIYQQIIDNISVRYQLLKVIRYGGLYTHQKHVNQCTTESLKDLHNNSDFGESDKKWIGIGMNCYFLPYKEQLIKFYELFKKCKPDPQVDVEQLANDIQKIDLLNLNPSVSNMVNVEWTMLKKISHKYTCLYQSFHF